MRVVTGKIKEMHVTDHSDLLAEVPYHQGRSKNGHGRTVLGHFGEIVGNRA